MFPVFHKHMIILDTAPNLAPCLIAPIIGGLYSEDQDNGNEAYYSTALTQFRMHPRKGYPRRAIPEQADRQVENELEG
jgi:hypothetical protein